MTCKINADTTDGLKIVSDTSGAIDFQKAGSTQVVIDTNGNIGAGTTSPTHLADAYTTIEAKGTATNGSGVILATSAAGIQTQMISSDASGIGTIGTRTNQPCTFSINNAEKARIDTTGNLYVGRTAAAAATNDSGIVLFGSGAIYSARDGTSTQSHMLFINNTAVSAATVGTIKTVGSTTQFNTSSDYRLKENVDYTWDATTRLKQLKPARFNFKIDADKTVDGFLAHEVSSIVPEAISGAKDAVQTWEEGEELPDGVSVGDNKLDDDGNTIPDYQGIDQSKLVPLLVKTIQELEARITALESE